MKATIAVAWLERPAMRHRWCRAASKTTLDSQDVVKTLCGYYVMLPTGFSYNVLLVDCEECLAKARQ